MHRYAGVMLEIKRIAEEALTIQERIEEWEKQFSHYKNPRAIALAGAVGELTAKFQQVKWLTEYAETPLGTAIAFAIELELELGRKQVINPDACKWYNGGYITVEATGDNGIDDIGFAVVEVNPSKSGIKKSVIADMGVVRTTEGWRVVNSENTPVDAEALADWLERKCDE